MRVSLFRPCTTCAWILRPRTAGARSFPSHPSATFPSPFRHASATLPTMLYSPFNPSCLPSFDLALFEVLDSASLLVEAASSAPRGDAHSGSSTQRSEVAVASALEVFQSRVDLFQAACDRAQQQVDAAWHRLLSESLVDEARGAASDTPAVGAAGEGEAQMVLGATRLEQISKAVRAMVQDLQHGHADKH
ncbi:unnamed protein product [Closterium sp. Naga37s-1]|nr:unnamed protein product [Closterium sp. Naga37s-1]